MATFDLTLDMKKQSIIPQMVTTRVGDSESCTLNVHLTENGKPYNIGSASDDFPMVALHCQIPGGRKIIGYAHQYEGNTFSYTLGDYVTRRAGIIKVAYFQITRYTTTQIDLEHGAGSANYVIKDSTESFTIVVLPGNIGELPQDYIHELEVAMTALKQQTSDAANAELAREAVISVQREQINALRNRIETALADASDAYQKAVTAKEQAEDAVASANQAASDAAEAISAVNTKGLWCASAAKKADEAAAAANAAAESVRNIETIEDSIAVQAIESLLAA